MFLTTTRTFFLCPRSASNTGEPPTPSSGEPYSLGAALRRKENWRQVPPWHQGIVGVKEIKEEIEYCGIGLRGVLSDRRGQRHLPGVGQGEALPILDQRDPEKVPGHLHELYHY